MAKEQIIYSDYVTTERGHYEPGKGFQVTTKRTGRVTITVDVEAIVKNYGGKALSNKSGKSQYMDGAIRFVASNVKDEPVAGSSP